MPSVRCSRVVAAELARTWDFVKEIDNWATLIPGYQDHEKIDDVRSRWTVRGEVGILARTVQLEVEIKEWLEEQQISFAITGISEVASGEGVFRLLGAGATIGDGRAPGLPDGAAGSGRATPHESASWLARALRRLRLLLGRKTVTTVHEEPGQVVGTGQSGFEFELAIGAGGMVGPVVNVMLESMIQNVGQEFADEVVAAIEGNGG